MHMTSVADTITSRSALRTEKIVVEISQNHKKTNLLIRHDGYIVIVFLSFFVI